jgi:hypothetical protein
VNIHLFFFLTDLLGGSLHKTKAETLTEGYQKVSLNFGLLDSKNGDRLIPCAFPDCRNAIYLDENERMARIPCDNCGKVTCVEHRTIHTEELPCEGIILCFSVFFWTSSLLAC